jgi:hypothetical protein
MIGIISLFLLSGCSAGYLSDREYGFRILQNDFTSTPQTSDLSYTVSLPQVHVLVVGSEQQLRFRMQLQPSSEPVLGVIGKRVHGKIVVNELLLGEQLQHLLHQQTSVISNPGSLDSAGAYRKSSDVIHRSFDQLTTTPDLNAKITLCNVRITIVGSQQQFHPPGMAAFHESALGYSTSDNEIWVLGSLRGGNIILNTAVLGHELAHLLNFEASAIADPDQLGVLFAANY